MKREIERQFFDECHKLARSPVKDKFPGSLLSSPFRV
jgi:hypothetical protein